MKPSELYNVLPIAFKENLNILLLGSPGVSKSEVITDIVQNILKWNMRIGHLIFKQPEDLKGLPMGGTVDNKLQADFIPYGDMRALMEAKEPLVYFLDDLGHANQSVANVAMQLILAREIDGNKISPHVRFIAASNNKSDGAGANGIGTALISRFHSVINIEPDAKDWCDWAMTRGNVPPILVSYISQYPQKITNFDPKDKKAVNFACPRTIANLGKWINNNVLSFEVWQGCVGITWATEFKAYYDTYTKIGNLPDQVIKSPTTADLPEKPDIAYLLLTALGYKADNKNFDNIVLYITRIPIEYQVFFMNLIKIKNKSLMETNAYNNWCVKNASSII